MTNITVTFSNGDQYFYDDEAVFTKNFRKLCNVYDGEKPSVTR